MYVFLIQNTSATGQMMATISPPVTGRDFPWWFRIREPSRIAIFSGVGIIVAQMLMTYDFSRLQSHDYLGCLWDSRMPVMTRMTLSLLHPNTSWGSVFYRYVLGVQTRSQEMFGCLGLYFWVWGARTKPCWVGGFRNANVSFLFWSKQSRTRIPYDIPRAWHLDLSWPWLSNLFFLGKKSNSKTFHARRSRGQLQVIGFNGKVQGSYIMTRWFQWLFSCFYHESL